VTELEPNPIRKIGFDIITLIDMDAAIEGLRHLWYGEAGKDRAQAIPFQTYGPVLFEVMRPRPGALGTLHDLVAEGCSLHFFCDIAESEIGELAEQWLQRWSGIRNLILHQIRENQSPVQLDCQAYVLAEDHGFEIPQGRPRVATHPRGGEFDQAVLDKARTFTVAKKPRGA
jgi:hypothetical protein